MTLQRSCLRTLRNSQRASPASAQAPVSASPSSPSSAGPSSQPWVKHEHRHASLASQVRHSSTLAMPVQHLTQTPQEQDREDQSQATTTKQQHRATRSSPRQPASAPTSLGRNLFSSSSSSSSASANASTDTSANPLTASASYKPPSHPLIKALWTQVYATHSRPNAEAVWQAYMALYSHAGQLVDLPSQLPRHLHAKVLRAIAPSTSDRLARRREVRQRNAWRRAHGDKVDQWAEAYGLAFADKRVLNIAKQHQHDLPESFAHRADFILAQLQRADGRASRGGQQDSAPAAQQYPPITDYNYVLSHAAHTGDLALVDIVWRRLAASPDSATGKTARARTVSPDRTSYRHTIMAHSAHLADYTDRAQLRLPKRRLDQASVPKYMELRAMARRSADRVLDLFRLAPPGDKQIFADAAIFFHLAKIMRLGGQLEGLVDLAKTFHGVDVRAPDAHVSAEGQLPSTVEFDSRGMDVVLEALGEQSTVSEMIAAYEGIRRPLPVGPVANSSDADADADADSTLKTDFRGMWADADGAAAEVTSPGHFSDTPPQFPPGPTPRTSTFILMLRNTSWPPQYGVGTDKLLLVSDGEAKARRRGDYLPVARWLIDEALDEYEAQVRGVAKALGLDVEYASEEAAASAAGAGIEAAVTDQNRSQAEFDGAPSASPPRGPPLPRPVPTHVLPSPSLSLPAQGTDAHTDTQTPPLLPYYNPPTLTPTLALFLPPFSVASRRLDTYMLEWLRGRVARAQALLRLERSVVSTGRDVWAERLGAVEGRDAVAVAVAPPAAAGAAIEPPAAAEAPAQEATPAVAPAETPAALGRPTLALSLSTLSEALSRQRSFLSLELRRLSTWEEEDCARRRAAVRERRAERGVRVRSRREREAEEREGRERMWRREGGGGVRREGEGEGQEQAQVL